MAKTKVEEAATSDGLEIIAIGSLYKGPWDKKYWSSSRGKDRYPYPVGYQAFRAYNGSTYKTEIHEGHKGPLFVISCEGQSCSGQTPDIAWDKFQKKGCTNLKIWHGKRFLLKIDGVEFFGFKNPFVQRLLRELVANINGTAEGSFLPSSICNGTSTIQHDNQSSNICTPSDFLPYLARPQIRKKQSKRCEITQSQSISVPGLKRPRSKNLTCDAKASNFIQKNVVQPKYGIPMPHSAAKEENDKLAGALSAPVQSSSAKDGFTFSVDSQYGKSTRTNCTSEELDRSHGTKLEGYGFPIKPYDRAGDSPVPNDFPGINNFHLFAPDTLDFAEDNCTNATSTARTTTGSVKEELTAANVVISDDLVTDFHQEEEIGTSNSNTGSEKSDFDSVGEEMAKLMMTVLLPQAIPLLKQNSKKKRKTSSQSKVSRDDNINNHLFPASGTTDLEKAIIPAADAQAEQDRIIHIQNKDQASIVPNLEYVNSVILDSFDNDQGEDQRQDHVDKQAVLFLNSNIQEKLVSTPVKQETLTCSDESCGNHDTVCHKEVKVASNKKSQEGEVTISKSEDTHCVNVNLDENSADISVEKKPKNALNCAEVLDTNDNNLRCIESPLQLSGNDIITVTRVPKTKDYYQAPSKVYTRKKVSKQAYSTRKYSGPLSESIIFRNSGDSCAPNTSSSMGTSLVSKSCRSSDDKPCNIDTFDAIPFAEGQSYGLPVEKTAINCKPEKSSVPPDLSNKIKKLMCTEVKDASCFLDPSDLLERSQGNGSKERLEDRIIVENGCSTSCQNQLNSCDKTNPTAREVQGSSDVNTCIELNSDLRDIVNLVGGYLHPLPISSVLLSTKGNEIYICVSCGLPVDKERTLFIYKIAIEEPMIGCPSFVGYTSLTLPFSEIDLERCGLQFTPDGQCLVLLGSIKTPYCREGRIDCTCSMCSSVCSKENAVKIVQVNPGYVSLVAKLETDESLQCILACEYNHIVAAGESGRLHLWVMNLTWSAWMEECIIPAGNCISSCIVELKRIPKCVHLVIGRNVFGEFIIWDILKRVIMSRFSASGNPIKQFLPMSLLNWKPAFSDADMDGHLDEIITASKIWFSEHKDCSSLQLEGEDIAVWLLVSTAFDMDAQHEKLSSHCQANPSRWWRLALLVKDRVILGSTLDPRAATIGASLNHGIMGRDDGLVYMWELSTGNKLGVLHRFKCGSVSCIATNDLRPDVLAIASDNGQLLVYQHSQQETLANKHESS